MSLLNGQRRRTEAVDAVAIAGFPLIRPGNEEIEDRSPCLKSAEFEIASLRAPSPAIGRMRIRERSPAPHLIEADSVCSIHTVRP